MSRPLLRAAAVLTVTAAGSWGIAIADILPPHDLLVDVGGAATVTVIAVACWLSERRRSDGVKAAALADGIELLARTLANVTQPGETPRKTLPLRRVR